MLERYARIARLLRRAWFLFALIMLGGAGAFVYGLFGDDRGAPEAYLLLPILTMLWAFSILLFTHTFASGVPVIDLQASFWHRLRIRLKRFVLHFFAIFIGALTLGCLSLSLRALSVIRNELGF